MIKVLILAYDFPPYVSVGGLRPYNWYNYFKEFGIDPVVVTRQWENRHGNHLDYIDASNSQSVIEEKNEKGLILRTPYKQNISNRLLFKYGSNRYVLFRKAVTAYYEFTQYLTKKGTKEALYREAKSYLKENQVDVIIATGEPFVLFSYASDLSKEFNIPWIADYRDPWSQNVIIQKQFFLKNWYRFFEQKVLKNVSCITTVSQFLKDNIAEIVDDKEIHILPNGYDPEAAENAENISQSRDIFQIAFIGTVYEWHPLRNFLSVLAEFVSTEVNIKLRFNVYGTNAEAKIINLIESEFPNLKEYVFLFPKDSNKNLLQKLAHHNLMLLFNDYSILGTKIFDYIAVRRKILLCFSEDEEALQLKKKYFKMKDTLNGKELQAELLERTNAGLIVKDADHLLKVLIESYNEFNKTGSVKCKSSGVENYSRKIQVKSFAEIIKKVSSTN